MLARTMLWARLSPVREWNRRNLRALARSSSRVSPHVSAVFCAFDREPERTPSSDSVYRPGAKSPSNLFRFGRGGGTKGKAGNSAVEARRRKISGEERPCASSLRARSMTRSPGSTVQCTSVVETGGSSAARAIRGSESRDRHATSRTPRLSISMQRAHSQFPVTMKCPFMPRSA